MSKHHCQNPVEQCYRIGSRKAQCASLLGVWQLGTALDMGNNFLTRAMKTRCLAPTLNFRHLQTWLLWCLKNMEVLL